MTILTKALNHENRMQRKASTLSIFVFNVTTVVLLDCRSEQSHSTKTREKERKPGLSLCTWRRPVPSRGGSAFFAVLLPSFLSQIGKRSAYEGSLLRFPSISATTVVSPRSAGDGTQPLTSKLRKHKDRTASTVSRLPRLEPGEYPDIRSMSVVQQTESLRFTPPF